MQYILFIIRAYSAKVQWELGAPGAQGSVGAGPGTRVPPTSSQCMLIVHALWFFFVDLLFEMRNPEGISESSFYTDSYIQKLWSWRL